LNTGTPPNKEVKDDLQRAGPQPARDLLEVETCKHPGSAMPVCSLLLGARFGAAAVSKQNHVPAMKRLIRRWKSIVTFLTVGCGALAAAAAPFSAFTYQGRLDAEGSAANGNYDVRFALFTSSEGGSAVAVVTNLNVAVSNGLFTTLVDFGAAVFDGTPYWLELAVRTNGGGEFSVLSPRQDLTAAPYAIYASKAAQASGVAPGADLTLYTPEGSTRVFLGGDNDGVGGKVSVHGAQGTETVEILGAKAPNGGGQILMRNAAGVSTIRMDADANTNGSGYIRLYKCDGTATITLEADTGGNGRITTEELHITGGLVANGTANFYGGFSSPSIEGGVFHGSAIGLSNGVPSLATNGTTAPDGFVLAKTGDRLRLEERVTPAQATNIASVIATDVASVLATNISSRLATNIAMFQITNRVRIYNVRDFGAPGTGNVVADSAALAAAVAGVTNTGGWVYFPAGRYIVTNQLVLNSWASRGFHGPAAAPEIGFMGDGEDASLIYFRITNGIAFDFPSQMAMFKSLHLVNDGAGSNICIRAGTAFTGMHGMMQNVSMSYWAIGAQLYSQTEASIENCRVNYGRVGIWAAGFCDGIQITGLRSRNTQYGVVIGGGPPWAPADYRVLNYRIEGTFNGSTNDIVVGGGCTGGHVTLYSEGCTDANVLVGWPGELFPGYGQLKMNAVGPLRIVGAVQGVGSNPFAALIVRASGLSLEACVSQGDLLHVRTNLAHNFSISGSYANVGNFIRWWDNSTWNPAPGQAAWTQYFYNGKLYANTVNVNTVVAATGFFGNGTGLTNVPGQIVASGFARMTNSTSTVNTEHADFANRIQITPYATNGTLPILAVTNLVDGASFTVASSLENDNETWFWWSVFKP
jgi:hypothetical protein